MRFVSVLILLFVSIPLFGVTPARRSRLALEEPWQFRQLATDGVAEAASQNRSNEGQGWMPAAVPGDVHLDLIRNNRIPDPFYRDNEAKLQWIEKVGWEYRTTITPSAATLSRGHVELVFDSLDTNASVYLNGARVAQPDNMFRQWRVDVKALLHTGANTLQIVFPAPLAIAKVIAAQDPWHDRTHTDLKGYLRKAVYEFGWDWGPRFATSGVCGPVYLDTWDDVRVQDVFVEQSDVSAATAHLDVRTELLSAGVTHARVVLEYGLNGQQSRLERDVTLAAGTNRITFPVEIDKPALWWPSGYGAQPIYHFHVSVAQAARVVDEKEVKTGLRRIELRRQPDQWGRSFEFVVNGVPVFVKGADIIPFDSFPNRATERQYRQILTSAKEANMNGVRVWGGGYYMPDIFYDTCDQLGLMVWHDLMFGNNWLPGTYDFKQNIQHEAEYQITRLRNHPSIVLWSGNNEVELLRDWNGNGDLPPKVHEHIWQDYLTEFSGVLATTEARTAPEVPYWPSSPSADYEELSDTYQSGDNHDWTVWHGKLDFSAYEQHHWRFVSEFGFQSFPEEKTVDSFTAPEDRTSIFSPVMLAHQKNSSGNSLLENYMHRYYGVPKDFNSYLYASQVLQAEALKVGVEGWRRARPRTMGTIFWQLNDCWPVASWSTIDYYGRWKAGQFYARRFYAPVLVSPHVEGEDLVIYGVSDLLKDQPAELTVRVMRMNGQLVKTVQQSVMLKQAGTTTLATIPFSSLKQDDGTQPDLKDIFVAASLQEDGKEVSSNVAYLVPVQQIHLPTAKITTRLTPAAGGYDLELTSPVLARSVRVDFPQLDAELSDNFVDLIPGSTVHLHVKTAATEEALQQSLRVVSIAEAFSGPAQL